MSVLNRIAWILATAGDDRVRDGARALAFAQRAATLTHRQDAQALDSLAAAFAELGQFDAAAATAREGLTVARSTGNLSSARGLEQRAGLYARGQKYRAP